MGVSLISSTMACRSAPQEPRQSQGIPVPRLRADHPAWLRFGCQHRRERMPISRTQARHSDPTDRQADPQTSETDKETTLGCRP